jgi:hypothetical protein
MRVVVWEVLGQDLAIQAIKGVDVVGSHVLAGYGFVLALVEHYFVLAFCDEKALIGFGDADGMFCCRTAPCRQYKKHQGGVGRKIFIYAILHRSITFRKQYGLFGDCPF